MHSFLIVAKDKNISSSYTSSLLKEKKINSFDINWEAYEKAIGIEDVRNIHKKILLKPFKSKIKAVVIEIFEGITIEAQNALLKTLEEPPANTIIIITTESKELILPTIISRCEIIILKEKGISLANEDLLEFSNTLNMLLSDKIGNKLKFAEVIAKNKEEAVVWLEKMAILVREKLIENYNDTKYLNFLKSLQKTYATVKSTNVNQRLALENLFLSF